MILSLIVIAVVGVISYLWLDRGLWSAFLHMVCVILAGSLAFAVWEPAALALAGSGSPMLLDVAWGVGLGAPFAVILLVLRVACDKLVPANLDMDRLTNMIGGGLCGLVAGTLSAGILVMSLGYTRLDTELFGLQAIRYSSNGSLTRQESLIYPADKITAAFYGTLSNGTLVPPSGESLGRRRPNLADENWLLRASYEKGKALLTIPPDAFEVVGSYRLAPSNQEDLYKDSFEAAKQQVSTVDGGQPPSPGEIQGYVVKFKPGAREQSGRVVVGPGQMRLVVANPNDPYDTYAAQPVAMISRAAGDKPTFGRWRFNAQEVFIASPGADDSPMAFEFIVPKGFSPLVLYVKGNPVDLTALKAKPRVFESAQSRDLAARGGGLASGGGGVKVAAGALKYKLNTQDFTAPVRISDSLTYGIVVQKDVRKDLEINDENRVNGGGVAKFTPNDLRNQGLEPSLQVRRFATSDDTVVVQIVVDKKNTAFGFLSGPAAEKDPNQHPFLTDTSGSEYRAVGYVYRTDGQTWIYFNPQSPLNSLNDHEMPTITPSKPNDELTLLFLVSKNVNLKQFGVGDKAFVEFEPPVPAK